MYVVVCIRIPNNIKKHGGYSVQKRKKAHTSEI
jgi:hypothetical protein